MSINRALSNKLFDYLANEVANSAYGNLYVVAGHPGQWPNNGDDPEAVGRSNYKITEVERQRLYGKKILPSNIYFMIRKYQWATGTIYAYADPESETLETSNYFIVNAYNDVFKCIYNNDGAPSTIEPSTKSNSIITTGDGYVWKYMYTVDIVANSQFGDDDFIPVTANSSVTANAVPGTLDFIEVTYPGESYMANHSANIQSVVSNTVFRLGPGAATITNFYANSSIYITGGSGTGNLSLIANSYSNSSGVFIKTSANLALSITSSYLISPTVNIFGDGLGAKAYSVMNPDNSIAKVIMISYGNNYSFANITFTGSNGYSTNAEARAIISPKHGHGYSVRDELYSTKMRIYMAFKESNDFLPSANFSYRQLSIVSNPLSQNGSPLTSNVINYSAFLTTANNQHWAVGDVIYGKTTNARGLVYEVSGNQTKIRNVLGVFANAEVVSNGNLELVVSNTVNSMVMRNSGELLYYTNEEPINRSANNYEFTTISIDII